MMKKFLLIMVAVLGMAVGAQAQRAQFQIGYGEATSLRTVTATSSTLCSTLCLTTVSTTT